MLIGLSNIQSNSKEPLHVCIVKYVVYETCKFKNRWVLFCGTLLMVLWVGLQCVIMVFPDHTLLIFGVKYLLYKDCFHIAYIFCMCLFVSVKMSLLRGAMGWSVTSDCDVILTHFFHPCIGLDKTYF